MIRKLILIGLVLAMLAVILLTWGSVGSAIVAYGLLMLLAALAHQRFITNRDGSDYQMEE